MFNHKRSPCQIQGTLFGRIHWRQQFKTNVVEKIKMVSGFRCT